MLQTLREYWVNVGYHILGQCPAANINPPINYLCCYYCYNPQTLMFLVSSKMLLTTFLHLSVSIENEFPTVLLIQLICDNYLQACV